MDTCGPDDIFLFLDEASVCYSPTLRWCWAPKGHQPEVSTTSSRKCQKIIGIVDPLDGSVDVVFPGTCKTPEFQSYLEHVIEVQQQKYAELGIPLGKIIIILDNARVHHAKALEPFLDRVKEDLELMFLPPYSPELDPIEHLWHLLRSEVTHNHSFDTWDDFITAMTTFFHKFEKSSVEIMSCCSISAYGII